MLENPVIERRRRSRKKLMILFCVSMFVVTFVVNFAINFKVYQRSVDFSLAVSQVTEPQITLDAVVPFAWDTLYLFPWDTTEEGMAERVGFQSMYFIQGKDPDVLLYYFTLEGQVVAACCGTAEQLGYSLELKEDFLEFGSGHLFQVETDPEGLPLLRELG